MSDEYASFSCAALGGAVGLRYFWYWRPDELFPPETIVHSEEFANSDRLNIACTQTNLSASRQKQVVDEWCDFLPTLTNVRLLWLDRKSVV